MSPQSLSLAELRAHPSVEKAFTVPTPTISGKAEVARGRDGPVFLSYKLYGNGPIKILWNNGHGAPMSSWRRQMIDFGLAEPEQYTSCFYSYRNYEESGSSWSLSSPKTAAEDALELMDHLGWTEERGTHVVGFSMGGYVAQNIALLAPRRLASVTFASTTSCVSSKFNLREVATVVADAVPRGEEKRWEWYKSKFFGPGWAEEPDEESLFPTNGDRIIAEDMLGPVVDNAKGVWLQMPGAYSHHVTAQQLAQIGDEVGRNRVLVIHGSADKGFALSHAETLHQGLGGNDRGVHLVVLDNAGHLAHVQQRKAFAEALKALFDRATNAE